MNLNKTLLLLVSVIVAGSLTSCSKQLEEVKPQEQISKQLALTDPNATQTLYAGVYSRLRAYNGTFFNLGEMRSDVWTDGMFLESADATSQQLYTHNISALNVPYGSWASFYNLIYNINNTIEVLKGSPVTESIKTRELAEMYGIRAYVYYTMLKTWGGVPLTTEAVSTLTNAAATYKPRSTSDSVMLQVKSDIAKSLELFGTSNVIPTGNRVFWNRVATLTLKGDVFLWSGTNMGGGAADYTTAKTALQEIKTIESASLKLNTSYADIFNPTKKSNNPEIIFALNYELGQATQGTFSSFFINGISASAYSFLQASTPTVATTYPYLAAANRVGMNQAMITRLTSGLADQRISNSIRVFYSTTAPYRTSGVVLSKWTGSVSGTSQVFNNDYPIYRYADVLLLLAEVKAKLGEDPSAEINQIRQRAYGVTAPVFVNGSESTNMDAILEEYLREFIGEGKRWWALRRAGDTYVYKNIKTSYLSSTTTAKMLLPISTSMLNNDPLLTQTPGY